MIRRLRNLGNAGLLVALILAVAPGRLSAQQHTEKAAGKAAEHGPAEGHPAPAGEHGGGDNPLEMKPALSVWTLVVFLVLMGVLGRFAWNPLLLALHKREQHMQHVLEETERARNESEGLLAEHRRQMARAADEVRGILDKARQEAQALADQLKKEAQEEAEATKQRAQRDIGAARDQALAEIWQKTADMAVLTAGRVLATELSADDHNRLLAAAIRELPAAAGTNGRGGLHS
jgi:F-type H+-transporting ATPase subunit b